MKGTWQTTDNGGSGLALVIAVILAAAVAVPVINAVTQLIEVLAIAVALLAGLALAAGGAVVAYRLRQRGTYRPAAGPFPGQVPWRRAEQLPVPPRSAAALPAPRAAEVHFHFHGVSAEEIAEIVQRQQED